MMLLLIPMLTGDDELGDWCCVDDDDVKNADAAECTCRWKC